MIRKQQSYKAGLYCRLSSEDGVNQVSVSIETQKALLTQYCRDNKIEIGEIYIDVCFSGTNFHRPDFERMLNDISFGKINIVVVKDLSRFGRNYVQSGLYAQDFTNNDVRFVAVDDGFDSLVNDNDIIFPIKNVLNEMYTRDISAKTKAAFRAKAREGEYISSRAAFGYMKDPENKHHLVIDEEAANTVRYIFKLAAEGLGYNKITQRMRAEKILTPIAYFNKNNPDFYKADYWRKEFDWHVTSVRFILTNEVYLGKTIFGKQRSKTIKSTQKINNPREEWIIVEGTHEPIVDKELFYMVQHLISVKRRTSKSGEVQIFSGLIRCADCGCALTYSQKPRADGTYHGAYSCWMYKTHGKEYCASHYITYDVVYKLVLEDLQRNLYYAKNYEESFLEMLDQHSRQKKAKKEKQAEKEIAMARQRLIELEKIKRRIYEDYALERISANRYDEMDAEYTAEQKQLKNAITKYEEECCSERFERERTERFMAAINKYTEITELDAKILNELIDKVVVHHKEKTPDGRTIQKAGGND